MKKILLYALSLVLVVAISIGGTLAYLQSNDSDVNVMTLGNVKISQHEYQRVTNEDGSYKTATIDNQTSYVLEAFEQGKELLPIVGDPSIGAAGWDDTIVRMSQVDSYGSMQVFAGANAQDKFVTVENTGKTDAYIRTIVAIECGSGDYSLIGKSSHSTWTCKNIGVVEIDNNKYFVFEFSYNGGKLSNGSWRHEGGVLPAGDTSYPSLSQVYLKSEATNEDMVAIDGNGNGTLDILVLSQAVQAAGFENANTALDTAFGKSSEKAAEWFGGVSIPNYVFDQAGFDAAIVNAGDIDLLCDVEFGGDIDLPTELDLGGYTLNSKGIEVANDFSMSNGRYVMKNTFYYIDVRPIESDTYTFTNVTFVNEVKVKPGNTGTDRVDQILKLYPMAAGLKSTYVFENCTFENAGVYFGASSDKSADIDVVFKNCTFNAMVASDALIEFGGTITGTVKIEGCTFNIEGTYSDQALIDIKTWSSITLDVTATDNVLNANKAVAYTYDPAKGETEADTIKLGTANVRSYYLFDCLTGNYSTVVETGTILKGDIAAPSK
ncbi:MAG: hypothetical protein E7633_06200 [Ruminococcaceae bacterium]|nr:hypothetical protein [Oscillospiraceae bacterium]